ncbi:MAG: hypothetical protein HKN20_02455 [Gemmatimonadetes bacterium]|nr:hypothetical protein [Gemmatimonadota bacterium]
MPIIEVEIVVDSSETEIAIPVQKLADALGGVLETKPGGTWVKVRTLAAGDYAENGASDPPRPVFVRVLKAGAGSADDRRREAPLLARAVADIVDRPAENVHILYEPPARGRIAFGGELRD